MNQNLEENQRLFRRWSRSYDNLLFQFWMKRFQMPVFQEINFGRKAMVLDTGCGTGELLKALEARDTNQNLQLQGLDYSPEMLSKAQTKLTRTKLAQGDIHQAPFRDNFFDYVLSTEAFHHYGNQPKALAEMVRVATKGGKVIVVDINFFLRPIHWLFERFEPGCRKVNSKQEMRWLFEQVGLQVIRQERSFVFAVMTVGAK